MSITATDAPSISNPKRKWSRYRHPESTIQFAVMMVILAFLGYSIAFLNIDLSRVLGAFPRLAEILATRYFPPDLGYVSEADFIRSVIRTLEMSLLGGFLGVVCSIPLAWLAASNITISKRIAYPLGRFAIMGSRSIHETIWTILFVTVLGFGMLAGTLALTVFCIGFAGKLFSDELEAMRSVGANPLQVFQYAVLPQVRVAFTGIAIYTWDVAFRAATVVGFFGGGGMGWYLKRTTQQLESTRVAAILLVIVGLVLLAELGSGWLRRKIGQMC